ncbi:AMP-binding protein [Laspinema olomoucense]|uniref:AMP-binding protein n=1 Tax=Laspinema olomoucense D3b TaxID=2953688 RepID=A0ABT2NDL4_9CYAN|nr:AMP-binding protein [Laspinema sp. D3b]MCT7979845.1 AMP-binding protein [Laspinema sp. D3b]
MTFSTLIHLLQTRAHQQPNQIAYTFLKNGKTPTSQLTYRQLDQKAKAIAAYLQSQLSPGSRVLLVYPQSLDAIAALFGCLYAGVIAIPAPAPDTTRLKRTLPRLEAIATDANASLILTTHNQLTRPNPALTFQAKSFVSQLNGSPSLFLHYTLQNHPQLATLPWTATDKIPLHFAHHWQNPQIDGHTLAYLQYTSGSTSIPKGVMLDHHNLISHLAELQQAGGYDSHSITVTWMPYFHDYGLVEGILEPLYNGTPCYLMSPTAFIKSPQRWLEAISHYRATHSQAPNFAYAYCLQRITPEPATLDLSHWQAAGNAAEPINPQVLEQFCQRFQPWGFRPQTFAPAYGLAEATLLVTTSRKSPSPVCCTVSQEALSQNRFVETAIGQKLAGSGRLLDNSQVAIVHPDTLTRCQPDEIGEIWVASAGVARGYWQRPDVTKDTFHAYLNDTGEGPFLRTGDLGAIHNGELFVTGRLKDLIIVRGENYYPQDIEWVAEKSHPALRPGYGAAFAVDVDGVEQLVIAFEVASKTPNLNEIVDAIRSALAEQFELSVYGVVLLKRGSILKTSSGKIQRQACRKAFLVGSWETLVTWTLDQPSPKSSDPPQNEAEERVAQIWQQVLGIESVNRTDNFFELGGNSLKGAVVVTEIEKVFGQQIPLASLTEAKTLEKFADQIVQKYWQTVGSRSLVYARPEGSKRPFFCVHAIGGRGGTANLARYLDPQRPVYGLQAVGIDGEKAPHTSIQPMVEHYIQEIQTVQPQGPYLLGGRCLGGNIALEMAQQLTQRREQVLLVAMLDSPNPLITAEQKNQQWTRWQSWGKEQQREKLQKQGLSPHLIENILKVSESNWQVIISHCPKIYSGRVVYFSAAENQALGLTLFDPMQPQGWNDFVAGGIEIIKFPGRHAGFNFQVLGEKLNTCLEQVPHLFCSKNSLGVTINI